ncbi:MAG: hypothetical protein HY291_04000 [Planctomycetes bacterium]|nr:hypothetical protein [Planctomycetota bacterium]
MRYALLLEVLVLSWGACAAETPGKPGAKPVLRDFLGLCTHTVQFKPKLYQPICRLARDYHPLEWDVGKDSDFALKFPEARNRVNWDSVYGSWKDGGFEVDCSIMFETLPHDGWKDLPRDAFNYAKAFAKFFGPSSEKKLVASVEIGNEPGKYDDPTYRKVFENMAKGFREGDPKLTVLTCNATAGKSGGYEKSLECVKGLEELYDAINVHDYAQAEGWPTWRRSFPEDPKIPYLKDLQAIADWRDKNAPTKPIWITEYGWDCSTQKPDPKTEFAKWVGVTDTQQAQYLVRSTLVFMGMDLARAYIYWFNDEDKASLHAAAGLTRHWKPKESYWAVAHLQKTLGEYRFAKAREKKTGELYVYEFEHGTDAKKHVLAVWSPTGEGRKGETEIDLGGGKLIKAERMPLKEGDVPAETLEVKDGKAKVSYDEAVIYLWVEGAAK